MKPRGQIDRSSCGGSSAVGGVAGDDRSWPEHGGDGGGDAIATVSPERLGFGLDTGEGSGVGRCGRFGPSWSGPTHLD
jgi:hypothetical protein